MLPAGLRIYAIGDVHGCAAALAALYDAIGADPAARPALSAQVVLVGDVIDRGPDTAGVLAGAARQAGGGDEQPLALLCRSRLPKQSRIAPGPTLLPAA
jgi:serine/threonine protein phosphatase 1